MRALVWGAVSGLASALPLPPWGWTGLAWLGALPWLLATRDRSRHRVALSSAGFGFALAAAHAAWLPGVLVDGFGARPVAALALWLACALAAVPAALALGLALRHVPVSSGLFPPAVGLGWAAVELAYARVCPGVPWLVLGAPHFEAPLRLLASVGGVHLVSGGVLAGNALIAQLLLCGASRRWLGAASALALAAAAAGWADPAPPTAAGAVEVGLVQPGAPPQRGRPARALARALALSRQLPAVDLIVWPEAALAATLEERPDLVEQVSALAAELDTPLVVGAYRRVPGGRTSSAVLFPPAGPPRVLHDKRRLLPFAESSPPLLGRLLAGQLGRLPGRLVSGTERAPVGGVALRICYEAAFSEPAGPPRAALLLHLASDRWYDTTAAADHLLLLARWRAVEAHAALARAASTGWSGFVLPDGSLLRGAPPRRPAALAARLELTPRVTLFERLGHAPLLVAGAVVWLAAVRRGTTRP